MIEGAESPLFLCTMIRKEHIETLVDEFLAGTDMFMVKLSVGKENMIKIYIDGDSGVQIDDCVALSRHIESSFDRDKEDFELSVSSAGIGEPLVHKRQYENRINKPVEVLLKDGAKFKAVLLGIDNNEINVARKIKSKQKKGNKFVTGDPEIISLDAIKQIKEIITI